MWMLLHVCYYYGIVLYFVLKGIFAMYFPDFYHLYFFTFIFFSGPVNTCDDSLNFTCNTDFKTIILCHFPPVGLSALCIQVQLVSAVNIRL